LRTTLASKAAALAAAEEQLRQEGAARQQAETQLQQEQAALAEAPAVLEQERLAREEAMGQLQQERTALEGAQAAVKQREDEVSRLNGELVQISISHEDLRQSHEEQEAMVLDLQHQAEEARKSLEGEKKQVEGEFTFVRFFACRFVLWGFAPDFVFLCSWLSGLQTALGNTTTQAKAVQTAYNRSWKSCGLPPSRPAKRSRRVRHRLGARWRAACMPSGGMSPSACAVPSTLASGRPSVWGGPITRWTSRPCPPATSSRSASRMRRQ
jgi:hypothetical protein